MLQNIRKRGITTFKGAGKKLKDLGDSPVIAPGIDPFNTEIPLILMETTNYIIMNGLKEEGLFRVPGLLSEVRELKNKYDRGEPVDLDGVRSIHTVGSVIKLYFAELPEPLLTFELMDCFMVAIEFSSKKEEEGEIDDMNLTAIRSCIRLLPPGNLAILEFIVFFFTKVSQHSDVNCMTPFNIATCLAPALVRRKITPTDMSVFLEESKKGLKLIESIIVKFDYMFEMKGGSSTKAADPEPIKEELVDQMKRGTILLASTLLRKEKEKLKQFEEVDSDTVENPNAPLKPKPDSEAKENVGTQKEVTAQIHEKLSAPGRGLNKSNNIYNSPKPIANPAPKNPQCNGLSKALLDAKKQKEEVQLKPTSPNIPPERPASPIAMPNLRPPTVNYNKAALSPKPVGPSTPTAPSKLRDDHSPYPHTSSSLNPNIGKSPNCNPPPNGNNEIRNQQPAMGMGLVRPGPGNLSTPPHSAKSSRELRRQQNASPNAMNAPPNRSPRVQNPPMNSPHKPSPPQHNQSPQIAQNNINNNFNSPGGNQQTPKNSPIIKTNEDQQKRGLVKSSLSYKPQQQHMNSNMNRNSNQIKNLKNNHVNNVINPSREENQAEPTENISNGEIEELASLLLQGKMKQANKLLEQKFKIDGYEGDIKNGRPHGKGKFVFRNGDIYEGEFRDGLRHGYGKITFQNGTLYEGNFISGKRCGWGKYSTPEGYSYEGEYVNGVRCGYGKQVYASGMVLEGLFAEGKLNGIGKTLYTSGDVYNGEHKDDTPHGYGEFTGVNGASFKGFYNFGERHGIGHYVSERGNKYMGEFVNDIMCGFGKYIFPSGDYYEGQFDSGKFNGEGRYTFQDGGFMQGLFENGQFVQQKEVDYTLIKEKVDQFKPENFI